MPATMAIGVATNTTSGARPGPARSWAPSAPVTTAERRRRNAAARHMDGKVAVALPGIQLHGAVQTLVGLAAGTRRAAVAPVGIHCATSSGTGG